MYLDYTCRENIFFPIINEMSTRAQFGKSGQELIHYCESVINRVKHKQVTFDNYQLEGVGLDPYQGTDQFI